MDSTLDSLAVQAVSAIALSQQDPLSVASETAMRRVVDTALARAAPSRDACSAQWLLDVVASVLMGSAERVVLTTEGTAPRQTQEMDGDTQECVCSHPPHSSPRCGTR